VKLKTRRLRFVNKTVNETIILYHKIVHLRTAYIIIIMYQRVLFHRITIVVQWKRHYGLAVCIYIVVYYAKLWTHFVNGSVVFGVIRCTPCFAGDMHYFYLMKFYIYLRMYIYIYYTARCTHALCTYTSYFPPSRRPEMFINSCCLRDHSRFRWCHDDIIMRV